MRIYWNSGKEFTFQYVSIISVIAGKIDLILSEFTFQYVSIISRANKEGCYSPK